MNSLDQALNEYIAIRRALGFELREVAGCLRNFVTFLKTEGASYITKELALRWAIQPAEAQPYTWAWRLVERTSGPHLHYSLRHSRSYWNAGE